MRIAVLRERRSGERRVAISPEMVKKYRALNVEVAVEQGAGLGASIPDSEFEAAGARIAGSAAEALEGATVLLKVQRPIAGGDDEAQAGGDEMALLHSGLTLLGVLNPMQHRDQVQAYAQAGVNAFAMEFMPRITRAQSMDVLSSQSNLAGYKAVLDASAEFGRAFPMMMTAAGTVAPAKVFVMGAGVAGLQAIATARRLGAIVSATDVRPATKEQVESLGAKFVMVEDEESAAAETAAGYAKEMSEAYRQKQAALVAEHIRKMDIVITTALIPGRPAPRLVSQEMVESMKPGSVLVDLAVESGGNVALSRPGEVVEHNGVRIVGHRNVPSRVAVDASQLYARNLYNFLSPHIDKESGAIRLDPADETVSGTQLTRDGAVVHPSLADAPATGGQ
ncbi:Re/Si-specific NAD(P)(+) transhydrogenase subunit alpha [Marinibaculum pumilum]|uniref:proton-translocating NAD(P)(+) transhydrogenase n=1 Tax=Marinibaculum pumilum TaxID=1766165 RepID=A0ABV7L6M4_9PROT